MKIEWASSFRSDGSRCEPPPSTMHGWLAKMRGTLLGNEELRSKGMREMRAARAARKRRAEKNRRPHRASTGRSIFSIFSFYMGPPKQPVQPRNPQKSSSRPTYRDHQSHRIHHTQNVRKSSGTSRKYNGRTNREPSPRSYNRSRNNRRSTRQ